MNSDGIDPVTADSQVMADLLRLWDDDGDVEEAAQQRGLHPPGVDDGATHGISLYYPPGFDDGQLIWDTSDLDVPATGRRCSTACGRPREPNML